MSYGTFYIQSQINLMLKFYVPQTFAMKKNDLRAKLSRTMLYRTVQNISIILSVPADFYTFGKLFSNYFFLLLQVFNNFC